MIRTGEAKGPGSMSTGSMKSKQPKELVLISLHHLVITNGKIKKKVVKEIVDHFDQEKFLPISCYRKAGKFIITDGNHRASAAKAMGHPFVPAIILTREEYDFVAYSKNTIDCLVFVPKKVTVFL